MACSDDVLTGVRTSELSLDAQDAATYVFVDGYLANEAGPVVLTVSAGPCPEHVMCVQDLDCRADERCTFDPVSETAYCIPAPADCVRDLDCGDGLVCNDGICNLPAEPDCRIDADCGAGEACLDGLCIAVPVPCAADADCAAGEACVDTVCVALPPECQVDADCQPGETCVVGHCEPLIPGGSCEAPTVIAAAGAYAGTTAGFESANVGGCAPSGGPELVYQIDPALGPVCLRTFGSSFDTVLYARSACGDEATQLGCVDDALGLQSELFVDEQAVPYFVFVDGFGADSAGPYVLNVTQGNCDVQCAVDADCPGAFVCEAGRCIAPTCGEDADCAPWEACVGRQCAAVPCGQDSDCGDGNLCEEGLCGPAQCSEDAECGRGYLCDSARCIGRPCDAEGLCADGQACVDGLCFDAPAGDACAAPVAIAALGTYRGTTVDAPNLYDAGCVAGISPEVAYLLDPGLGVVCAEVHGAFDSVLHVRRACGDAASELACNDDLAAGVLGSRIDLDLSGAPAFLLVDGFSGQSGTYVLTLSEGPCGELTPCEADVDCNAGQLCAGGVCTAPACVESADCRPFRECAGGRCIEQACDLDAECGGGLCEGGICGPIQCAEAVDCGDFRTCDAGRCNPIVCDLDAECADGICEGGFCSAPLCSADAECGLFETCAAGRCAAVACLVDADCPAGAICGADATCVAAECALAVDCLPGFDCQNARCVELSCVSDEDCVAGQLCIDALCLDAPNGDACDTATNIAAFGAFPGTTVGSSTLYRATCGQGSTGPEQVFLLDPGLGLACLTTYGTGFDTVLHARAECGLSATESGCNDDAFRTQSALTVDAAAGAAYVFVDGYNGAAGDFVLNVGEGPCQPIECLADLDCAPGFACDAGACIAIPPPPCQGDADCAPNEVCVDTVCVPRIACVTSADCAGGELCDQGLCVLAPPACLLPLVIETAGSFVGTTLGGSATQAGSCGGAGTEVAFNLSPDLGVVCVDTVGSAFDTVLYTRTGCDDPSSEANCSDDASGLGAASEITVPLSDGPRYLFVDGFRAGAGGDFVVNVSEGACVCRSDAACGDAQHCIEGGCVDIPPGGCLLDLDCADGETCVEEACTPPSNACDFAEALPAGNSVHLVASTDGASGSSQAGNCSAANGPEKVYLVEVPVRSFFSATVSGFDTVLYLRSDCYDGATEVACNDDGDAGAGSSIGETLLEAGVYALVVDGYSAGQFGEFTLDVNLRADCPAGPGEYCGSAELGQDPGNRYTCDQGNYQATETCWYGCQDAVCLAPAHVGTCADPMVMPFGRSVTVRDDTARGGPNYRGSCGGGGARDLVYRLDLPRATTVDILTTGFNTVLYGRSTCEDTLTQVSCNNDSTPPGNGGSRLFRRLAAGTYYIFIDGRSGAAGPFEMTMTTN